MSEKIYPKGIRFDKPREGAPSFVLARVGFFTTDITSFLEQHTKENGWCDFDLLEGKDTPYLVLNQWTKPSEEQTVNEPKATDNPFDSDIF